MKTILLKKILALLLLLPVYALFCQEPDELYLKPKGWRFNGSSVIQLQRFLLWKGFDLGPDMVDGWFGTDTEKALKAYQKSIGLSETGRIKTIDIPFDLKWKPFLNYKEPAKGFVLYEGKLFQIDKDGLYDTGYGPFLIENSRYQELHFVTGYIFSPNKRFCYTQYYTPEAELQMGQPIILMDTLTLKNYHLSAFDAYMDVNDPAYNGLYDKTRVSQFIEIRWTQDNNLYLKIIIDLNDGNIIQATRLLTLEMK